MLSIFFSEKSWFISSIILFSALSRKALSYPEIHFVLAKGLSFITRRQPEIVFDAPWRVEQGEPIPIVCIINDAHLYPIELLNINVQVFGDGFQQDYSLSDIFTEHLYPRHIKDIYWYALGHIQPPEDFVGPISINPQVEFTLKGKRPLTRNRTRIIYTDNLPGLSHAPLRTYIAREPLPTFDGWYYGDAHWHSDKTRDQVEFAAPVEVAAVFSKAIGIRWLAVTDHSYDLDSPLDDYISIDPDLPKWRMLGTEIKAVNATYDDLVVLRGEEVSCGNAKGQNVHLLVYGVPEFIPGRGDAGKTGFEFKFEPDLSLQDVLERVREYNGVTYAAHPNADNSFLGKLILNRGTWLDADCELEGCYGLQFWNGCTGKRFTKGYKRWVRLLLEGYRRYTIAGSDAHGDFNRIRQMKFPFVKLCEYMGSAFGKPRTCLYCGETLNESRILDALRHGRAVLTDGPIAIFTIQNAHGHTANIGETLSIGEPQESVALKFQIKSTEEFGPLSKAVLYRGDLSRKIETIELELDLNTIPNRYEHQFQHFTTARTNCYFRLDAKSQKDGYEYRCITNPIWVNA